MSNLVLNDAIEVYKHFEGRIIDMMPPLIEEGRTPLSARGLMRRRLQVLSSADAVKASWWNNYVDTGDGIAYHPDGRIKVVPDSRHLRELNTESRLFTGSLVLEDGVFDSLEGTEFTPKDVKKYAQNRVLTETEVTQNPVWLALARDQVLLQEYAGETFRQAKERFNRDNNMGVYVHEAPEKAIMRALFVGALVDNYYSDADGYYGGLDYGGGRLVGVAPEAQVRENDQVVKPTHE